VKTVLPEKLTVMLIFHPKTYQKLRIHDKIQLVAEACLFMQVKENFISKNLQTDPNISKKVKIEFLYLMPKGILKFRHQKVQIEILKEINR